MYSVRMEETSELSICGRGLYGISISKNELRHNNVLPRVLGLDSSKALPHSPLYIKTVFTVCIPAGWVDEGPTREIRIHRAVERVVRRTVERMLVEARLGHHPLGVVHIVAAAHEELEVPLEHHVHQNVAKGRGYVALVARFSALKVDAAGMVVQRHRHSCCSYSERSIYDEYGVVCHRNVGGHLNFAQESRWQNNAHTIYICRANKNIAPVRTSTGKRVRADGSRFSEPGRALQHGTELTFFFRSSLEIWAKRFSPKTLFLRTGSNPSVPHIFNIHIPPVYHVMDLPALYSRLLSSSTQRLG